MGYVDDIHLSVYQMIAACSHLHGGGYGVESLRRKMIPNTLDQENEMKKSCSTCIHQNANGCDDSNVCLEDDTDGNFKYTYWESIHQEDRSCTTCDLDGHVTCPEGVCLNNNYSHYVALGEAYSVKVEESNVGVEDIYPSSDPYAKLLEVFDKAYFQASQGKGKERHATEGEAFHAQQIVEIARRLGDNSGPLYQAVKKIYESKRLDKEKANHELYGALNYIAAAILLNDEGVK